MSSTGSGSVARRQEPCVMCGVISGAGLTGAGIYVYIKIRRFIVPGTTSPLLILPLVFSLGLMGFGISHLSKTAQYYSSHK